jgi:hypothetical protein
MKRGVDDVDVCCDDGDRRRLRPNDAADDNRNTHAMDNGAGNVVFVRGYDKAAGILEDAAECVSTLVVTSHHLQTHHALMEFVDALRRGGGTHALGAAAAYTAQSAEDTLRVCNALIMPAADMVDDVCGFVVGPTLTAMSVWGHVPSVFRQGVMCVRRLIEATTRRHLPLGVGGVSSLIDAVALAHVNRDTFYVDDVTRCNMFACFTAARVCDCPSWGDFVEHVLQEAASSSSDIGGVLSADVVVDAAHVATCAVMDRPDPPTCELIVMALKGLVVSAVNVNASRWKVVARIVIQQLGTMQSVAKVAAHVVDITRAALHYRACEKSALESVGEMLLCTAAKHPTSMCAITDHDPEIFETIAHALGAWVEGGVDGLAAHHHHHMEEKV